MQIVSRIFYIFVKILITQALPAFAVQPTSPSEFIEKYRVQSAGETMVSYGLNCFATATAAAGVLSYSGHVTSEEFDHWMKSPLCDEVTDQEKAFGDIMAVFSLKKQTSEHAGLFVSSSQVFEKASFNAKDPPRLVSVKQSLGNYPSSNYGVRYYRCRPVTEVLDPLVAKSSKEVQEFFRRVKFIEEDLHRYSYVQVPIDEKIRGSMVQINNRQNELNQILHARFLGLTDSKAQEWQDFPTWLLVGYSNRLNSLMKQVTFLYWHNIMGDY